MIDLVEMNLGTLKELDGNTLETYVWVYVGTIDILQVAGEMLFLNWFSRVQIQTIVISSRDQGPYLKTFYCFFFAYEV